MSKSGYDFLTANYSPVYYNGGYSDNAYLTLDKSKYLASDWSTTDQDPSAWDWPYNINLSFTADSGATTLNYKNYQTSSDSSTDIGSSYSNSYDVSIDFKSKLGDSIFRSDVYSSAASQDLNGNYTAFKSNQVDKISYVNTNGTTTSKDDFSAASTTCGTRLQTNDPLDSNKYSTYHTVDFNYKATDGLNGYSLSMTEIYKQTIGTDLTKDKHNPAHGT